MKETLRKLCSPILNHFESGDENYNYKQSHRTILIVASVLFWLFSLYSLLIFIKSEKYAGFVPVAIFIIAGTVCGIVGYLGSDKAVAKIWRNR